MVATHKPDKRKGKKMTESLGDVSTQVIKQPVAQKKRVGRAVAAKKS